MHAYVYIYIYIYIYTHIHKDTTYSIRAYTIYGIVYNTITLYIYIYIYIYICTPHTYRSMYTTRRAASAAAAGSE